MWRSGDSLLHTNIPSLQYGHCKFTLVGTLVSFAVLVRQVSGEGLFDISTALPDEAAQVEFRLLTEQYARPDLEHVRPDLESVPSNLGEQ